MKKFLIALLFAPVMAFASGTAVYVDKWPGSVSDKAALQNGAKLFINYCLNCHGTSYLRYQNLLDLGLSEQQVKDNLMFTSDKIGSLMGVAARSDEQKIWFGATPPDLTILARARGEAGNAGAGADWLYTYLRSFYRDENRPTGWNNTVFENVGMPHVLYGLQGQQTLNHETHKLELAVPGQLAPAEFDKAVSDLVGFMVWMGEPQQEFRRTLGFFVLAFLGLLFVLAYALKKEYWKDIQRRRSDERARGDRREILAQPVEPGPLLVELPPVISDPTPIDNTPRWVKHTIIPGEDLDDVAARNNVDRRRLARWNNLKGDKPALRACKQLRVHAVNPPAQRERVEHVVKRGEDWDSVAKAYGVKPEAVQAWNRKLGTT